ncbi:Serine/arginine-rich splicing factor RSZ22 [Glycine soja]
MTLNLQLKSFKKWNAPEENCREGRRGRLKFFLEKENQETQQPHPKEGNAPEKNPHCVAVVLPGKDAGGRSSEKMSRVYVGNLDSGVTERDVKDEFRVFGVIRRHNSIITTV